MCKGIGCEIENALPPDQYIYVGFLYFRFSAISDICGSVIVILLNSFLWCTLLLISLFGLFCHVGSLRLRSWFESAFLLFEVSRISSCDHWLCSVISQGNPKNYCHHFCCRRSVIKFQIPKKAKLHEPPSVRSFLRSFRTFKIIGEDVRIISFAANWCYKFCCSTHFRPIKYRSWLKISSCFFCSSSVSLPSFTFSCCGCCCTKFCPAVSSYHLLLHDDRQQAASFWYLIEIYEAIFNDSHDEPFEGLSDALQKGRNVMKFLKMR